MPKTDSYALLLRPNASFTVLDWPTTGQLPVLYDAIGCTYVDAVDVTAHITMWLDDEGCLNGSAPNLPALNLFSTFNEPHQPYWGNVVFTGGTDRNGDTLGLTKDELLHLIERHLILATHTKLQLLALLEEHLAPHGE
ncbi:DUF3846 domain-containing protein [Streptomyces werraensis]|uniref:DUF3846 domain-containing protein n=1 Tax=Streptomyces werraensis TaxID=68284 RepID=UPI0036A5B7F8